MSVPSSAIPLLIPGAILVVVLAIALARVVGGRLEVAPAVASVLIAGFGLVLVVTLTPTASAFFDRVPSDGVCDLSRMGIAPIRDLLRPSSASLGVLLFVPLGIGVGLLPRSRLGGGVAVAALLLPFVVEAIQLSVPLLGRDCRSADVADNLMGLTLGVVIGLVARKVSRGRQRDTTDM